MEIGRGRRLILLVAALSTGAEAACLIDPGERKLDFRVSPDRSAVALLRQRAPDTVPPICILRLECKVREAKPSNMSYSLRAGSFLPGDIEAVEFYFRDGSRQRCNVLEIKAP